MDTDGRILLVEDDQAFASEFCAFLDTFGYLANVATSLDQLKAMSAANVFDLIILDQFLNGQDSLRYLPELRQRHHGGLIILTNNQDEADRILGLELGADDFIPKTQKPREILARVRAVLRRATRGQAAPEQAGWEIDQARREARGPDGKPLPLTSAEYNLLLFIVGRQGEVVDRDELYRVVIGREKAGPFDRTLDNLISRVRKTIAACSDYSDAFKSVRGRGYFYAGPPFVIVGDTGKPRGGA
ncbi:MAG TPA: response regulator transcription factor [Rhodopila sp.]|uniref:response regulator transcription factor n=1 Tax=Rhodopila sp. TaxID=2480087 RepID=UPI002CB7BB57|nr:response regulator transcription factor [Rhodopila sp.]HVY14347.1 response regulator transcription factor [Rhodopila sp.]